MFDKIKRLVKRLMRMFERVDYNKYYFTDSVYISIYSTYEEYFVVDDWFNLDGNQNNPDVKLQLAFIFHSDQNHRLAYPLAYCMSKFYIINRNSEVIAPDFDDLGTPYLCDRFYPIELSEETVTMLLSKVPI